MDGVPLELAFVRSIAASVKDEFAISFAEGPHGAPMAFGWNAQKGWHRLPPSGDITLNWLAFDPDGQLYCLRGRDVCRLNDGGWEKVFTALPDCNFVPMKEGFFLPDCGPPGHKPGVARIEKGEARIVEFDRQRWTLQQSFFVNGRTFGLFLTDASKSMLCQITAEKLIDLGEGVGLDLTGKGLLVDVDLHVWPPRDNIRCTADGATAPRDADLEFGSTGNEFVRDANGHFWAGANRWDGKKWRSTLPDNYVPDLDLLNAGKYRFDESKRRWDRLAATTAPEMMPSASDPAAPDYAGHRQLKDAAGQWWWIGQERIATGMGRFVPIRLDSDGKVHIYPPLNIDGGFPPQILLSPAGRIWTSSEEGHRAYDPAKDQFAAGEAWDEFSFNFGPWKLSMAGKQGFGGQQVYRKESGKWKPLVIQYGGDSVPGAAKSSPRPPSDVRHPVISWGVGRLLGSPNLVHGQRILFSCDLGVIEYDVENDRWTVLLEAREYRACFDARGRRILIGQCALMFEGESFAGPQDEGQYVKKLLNAMADPSWTASEDDLMRIQRCPSIRGRLVEELASLEQQQKWPTGSADLQSRLDKLIEDSGPPWLGGIASVFRQMHPLAK